MFMSIQVESAHFRSRARHCRELAQGARDELSRRELSEIANELDAEADAIDAEAGQHKPELKQPPLT